VSNVGQTFEQIQARQWFIVGRWAQYGAEARANLLRILGVATFYLIELAAFYGLPGILARPAEPDARFHLAITALAATWVALALLVLLLLRERIFPKSLPYLTTAADLVLLTGMVILADGPRSPLVVVYFLVLALAATRFDLRLLWFATCGTLASYAALLGYAKWFAKRDVMVARHAELIVAAALVLLAVVLGQMIRRVRQMAEEYAARLAATEGRS